MSEICKICGTEKIDGKCPNAEMHLKKMCLNCVSCNIIDNGHVCLNEENLNDAMEKVKANVPSGYEIENLELKPLALKDATKKCKRWVLDRDFIMEELLNI